jgi:hypothetical protein
MEESKALFCSSKFPWARERISSKSIEKNGQALSKGFASPDPGTDCPHCTSDCDHYLDWRVGLVFVCPSRLREDGTPVRKHVVV